MGLTNERFVVKESRRARRKTAVRFLIDSGAVYSLVPGPTLKKLGIRPHRTVDFALADGTTITRQVGDAYLDRKSTRLNSSHTVISYAVFCLKKKNTHPPRAPSIA